MDRIEEALLRRFLRYSTIPSESKAGVSTVPSSVGQRKLAELLLSELEEMGATDIHLSQNSVLTARFPGNVEGRKTIGWICHLDTVDVSLSPVVHPMLVENYQGQDIVREKGKTITLSDRPELRDHIGKDILFSDGSSVLGADDKAAIAIVMEALDTLRHDDNLSHGDIIVAFVPDEEVGLKGAKAMDLSRFPVDWAYTIDCCRKGEVVWETFNAGEAEVTFEGITAHPMSSKGVLVNPILMANDFLSLFSRDETPENTEGKEGFIYAKGIEGGARVCSLRLLIRDHSREKYEEKKNTIRKNAEKIRELYPRGKVEVTISDTYGNILDAVTEDNRIAIHNLKEALKANGIEEIPLSMRGGTDGSFISTKGILVPNYFTGALNFHSSEEFWPLEDGKASYLVTLSLMTGSC